MIPTDYIALHLCEREKFWKLIIPIVPCTWYRYIFIFPTFSLVLEFRVFFIAFTHRITGLFCRMRPQRRFCTKKMTPWKIQISFRDRNKKVILFGYKNPVILLFFSLILVRSRHHIVTNTSNLRIQTTVILYKFCATREMKKHILSRKFRNFHLDLRIFPFLGLRHYRKLTRRPG